MTTLARCRHFGRCGGCTALDVPIATQLTRKVETTTRTLAPYLRATTLAVEVPTDEPYHDRLKLLFPARADRDGSLRLGLYAVRSHDLVQIEECLLQAQGLTLLARRAEAILRSRALAPYDEVRHAGLVRALHARIAAGTGELLIGLVTRTPDLADAEGLADAILDAAHDLPTATTKPVVAVGVVHNIHPARGNFLLGPTTRALRGRDHLFDAADGLSIRVSFASFLQVHRAADAILVRPALAMLGDVRARTVVDGYGGVGTFGLRLARAGAREVTIVEASPSSCADARCNVEANALACVAVVEAPFATAADLPARPDVVVVDPPRVGLTEAGCARLLALDAPRVLYVSCNPASLALDLARLDAAYAVTAARLVDLFPHTDHAEVVLRLERRRG